MGRPEPLPSPHLPMGRQLLPGEDRPPSEYLSLDTVQAPEPEDLAAAQLHLRVVDLVQPLRVLGDLLFGGAVPSLLQELQGLGRYRGDHLRTGAAKGKTPKSGREGGHSAHLVRPSCSHSLPPHPLGGGAEWEKCQPSRASTPQGLPNGRPSGRFSVFVDTRRRTAIHVLGQPSAWLVTYLVLLLSQFLLSILPRVF